MIERDKVSIDSRIEYWIRLSIEIHCAIKYFVEVLYNLLSIKKPVYWLPCETMLWMSLPRDSNKLVYEQLQNTIQIKCRTDQIYYRYKFFHSAIYTRLTSNPVKHFHLKLKQKRTIFDIVLHFILAAAVEFLFQYLNENLFIFHFVCASWSFSSEMPIQLNLTF